MAARSWHEERWFDSVDGTALPSHYEGCFGCGPERPQGLGVVAHLDGAEITTTHVFAGHHSGAPGIAHGGVVATLVDEMLGYLLYVVRSLGVTRRLEIDYLKPVLLGVPYDVRARVDRRDGRKVFVSCEGSGPDKAVVFKATGLFILVPTEHFAQGAGSLESGPVAL